MKRATLLVLLCGCGPQFAGKWVGSLNETGKCSDGSGTSFSSPVSWVISEDAGRLTIITTGNCGMFSAVQRGSSAQFDRRECPTTTQDGFTSKMTLTGGTLNLNESTLSVTMASTYKVSTGTSAGTCDTTATGTLGSVE